MCSHGWPPPAATDGKPGSPGQLRPQNHARRGAGNLRVNYWYSKVCNSLSGPEIGLLGRILAGLLPGKHRHPPSGRPKAGRRADFCISPVAVRPKNGPEARFPTRKHYCVT